MSEATFPPVGIKEDSRHFKIEREDKAILSETHGYVYSRPRHARKARRKFTTGLTEISQAQFNLVDSFIERHGRYRIFRYTIPTTREVVRVRFEAMPMASYSGLGGFHRWNYADIKLVEV